jgi:hypothetical protein
LSIKVRGFAHIFVNPGQEMLLTAPELNFLEPITSQVEEQILATRLSREMLPKGRSAVTHRPFQLVALNGARIYGRIPQRDGRGVKGCVKDDTLVLTKRGLVRADEVTVDDCVWSHERRWAKVLGVDVFEDDDCYEMRGAGSFPTVVNGRHAVYGRRPLNTPKQKRRLGGLSWATVQELKEGDRFYWAGCADFPASQSIEVPALNAYGKDFDLTSEDFWWVAGRWLADGYGESGTVKRSGKVTGGRVCFVVHPSDQDEILLRLKRLGLSPTIFKRSFSSADVIQVCSTAWIQWLYEHFGHLANGKKIPSFAYFLSVENRRSLLDGYLSGDGTHTITRPRHEASSASKGLALGIGILGQTLGYGAGFSTATINVTEVMGVPLKNPAQDSHRVRLSWKGHAVFEDGHVSHSLNSVIPVGPQVVVNIVSADHSYLANGIFHHNTHPLWLESDEYQDYPRPGHTELIETLKRGIEGAVWRAHGVTRGVRDAFYDITSYANDMPPLREAPKRNDADWTVHRIVAMAREDWTDEERQEKIHQYGSKEDPDYRRNILGSHGDSTSAIFVISRLMKNVDDDPSSTYNTDEYFHFDIKDSELERKGGDVVDMLDFPASHQKYKTTWAGADIGFVQDPTEILVFGEQPLTSEEKREMSSRDKAIPAEGRSRLKLLTRISMRRIPEPAQADVIMRVIEYYRPKAFAMDSTGVGLPLYQQVQERMSDAADVLKSQRAREAAECIKPYNFSSKILVDFDETMTLPEDSTISDKVKEAGIYRMVLEVSTDVLRTYVDEQRLWLPWDRELISEMQGQTFSYSKSQMDQYGRRRIFSKGTFHALDAMRMAALGHKQFALEALVKAKEPEDEPVLDVGMTYDQFY